VGVRYLAERGLPPLGRAMLDVLAEA